MRILIYRIGTKKYYINNINTNKYGPSYSDLLYKEYKHYNNYLKREILRSKHNGRRIKEHFYIYNQLCQKSDYLKELQTLLGISYDIHIYI